MRTTYSILILGLVFGGAVSAQVPQISIDRITQMPDSPSPYLMRDWQEVALGYDALIYDLNKVGDYLPLSFINESGINYPANKNFGLRTYVGTFSTGGGEAINVLPSLIGASLVGIDKSNQFGQNWVLMGQDFFNNRPEENVYLNNHTGRSGNDWWYDIMPNIYFYQLHSLYPGVGEGNMQFVSIADQWLKAVKAMGAKDTPWVVPSMNYRAWSLSTMTPLTEGVKEPEAAGGIAWLLYHGYLETGDNRYLKGAEWSMEFLNSLSANPSYELQLPYGIYTAAKMNAQLGTNYDIEKMINWAFDRGELRGWGSIVGNWNGVEASGLIGEANDNGNDYAFLMNGFQHAGALVPMVRYDKRFATSIGKWMLNVTNASRLFYPGFLPEGQQDASEWSVEYDPEGNIGYEALREKLSGNPGPFSTGDAKAAGWAETNLALYGSSSVGIFGGIVKITNVEKILQLDILKTDFFREDAYPTFLYYNPHSSDQTVNIDVGGEPVDLYEALSETFLSEDVSGTTTFSIPGKGAVLVVLAPGGGTITYDQDKMLIDEIIVDYLQTAVEYNASPRIKSLGASEVLVEKNSTATLYTTATDREGEDLTYSWKVNEEIQIGTGPVLDWTAPETTGNYLVAVTVSDPQLNETSESLTIEVVDHINSVPIILDITVSKHNAGLLEVVKFVCLTQDADNDPLSFSWSANAGTFDGTGDEVLWQAPEMEGVYEITVVVEDGNGGRAESKVNLMVKDYSALEKGSLVAYYPFSGNAKDSGGNSLDGQVMGAVLVEDLQGQGSRAYHFDGNNDRIRVGNEVILNFRDAITVSAWVRPEKTSSSSEAFILSHGSWQNRWKLSLVSGKVRWTLNTSTTIRDVDSSFGLAEGEPYQLTATYDGNYALLYINGKLDGYTELSGRLNTSPVDLLMGQMLPDNDSYNYRGLIDEVMIYDYALSHDEVIENMQAPLITGVNSTGVEGFIQLYPNPTSGKITLEQSNEKPIVFIRVYNSLGKLIEVELNQEITTQWLDLEGIPNGLYLIEVTGAGFTEVRRVLVKK